MVKITKNTLGNINGSDNIVIQIIDSNGKEITDNLGPILERISENSIRKIKALERKIDSLKRKNRTKKKKNRRQADEILALKAKLAETIEILKIKQRQEAEVLQNINGLDFREINPTYAKAFEYFIQGKSVKALNLLDRARLIQRRKSLEKEQKEEIRAWQLRLTLLENSKDFKQDELDECYVVLSELDPSFSSLISAANYFLRTNDFRKAQYYCDEASKKIKYAHELAFTLTQLGILQTEISKYRFARKNFIKAINIYEYLVKKAPNSDESNLAVAYSHLGHYYNRRGRYKKAKKILNRAIEIQESLLKDDDIEYSLAISIINLANVQTDTNKINEAIVSFNRGLELMRKLEKESNGLYLPDIALICHNYAHALVWRTNDYDKALHLINEAIRIRRNLEKLIPRQYSPLLATSLVVKRQILYIKKSSASELKLMKITMNLGAKFKSWFSF